MDSDHLVKISWYKGQADKAECWKITFFFIRIVEVHKSYKDIRQKKA